MHDVVEIEEVGQSRHEKVVTGTIPGTFFYWKNIYGKPSMSVYTR